jgi:hypothetical protein
MVAGARALRDGGGWNGEMVPDGFSTVGPDVYPPENTSGEVWSSADGVTWTLDLPHGHGQFERRHSAQHGAVERGVMDDRRGSSPGVLQP